MRFRTLSTLLLLAGLVIVAGCSGGGPESGGVTPTPTASPEETATRTATPTPEPPPATERFASTEWNFSVEYPRDWELAVAKNASDALKVEASSISGSFAAEAKRTHITGAGEYADLLVDDLKTSPPYQEATFEVENGTLVNDSRVITIEGITEPGEPVTLKQKVVISVRPGDGEYTVYTLTFTQTQADFDRSWEEDFEPILESFEVDRDAE